MLDKGRARRHLFTAVTHLVRWLAVVVTLVTLGLGYAAARSEWLLEFAATDPAASATGAAASGGRSPNDDAKPSAVEAMRHGGTSRADHPLVSQGHSQDGVSPMTFLTLPSAPDDRDEDAGYGEDVRPSQSSTKVPAPRSESLHVALRAPEIRASRGHHRGPDEPPRV